MVWGDSSLLSALCTGPCGVEIGAALPKVTVSEEIAEMQSTQGHPAGMHLPFLVPWGDLLALTVYCVALQVVFMALSSKEELDIVMMIPFLPNPHSAPSFSGMHAPCKWSRGLLPCVFLPGLVPSVSLTIPGACTHFRTEVLSFFFFLALIPEQLVAVSFSEKSKMCLCTGRKKKSSVLHLQRRWHRKYKVDLCSCGNHWKTMAGCQHWGMLCMSQVEWKTLVSEG